MLMRYRQGEKNPNKVLRQGSKIHHSWTPEVKKATFTAKMTVPQQRTVIKQMCGCVHTTAMGAPIQKQIIQNPIRVIDWWSVLKQLAFLSRQKVHHKYIYLRLLQKVVLHSQHGRTGGLLPDRGNLGDFPWVLVKQGMLFNYSTRSRATVLRRMAYGTKGEHQASRKKHAERLY